MKKNKIAAILILTFSLVGIFSIVGYIAGAKIFFIMFIMSILCIGVIWGIVKLINSSTLEDD